MDLVFSVVGNGDLYQVEASYDCVEPKSPLSLLSQRLIVQKITGNEGELSKPEMAMWLSFFGDSAMKRARETYGAKGKLNLPGV